MDSARRHLLVALAAADDLGVDGACRLAQELPRWWPPPRGAPHRLAAELGLPVALLERALALAGPAAEIAGAAETAAAAAGASILTLEDEGYPAELRDLDLPPVALWVRGALPPAPRVAIVGSRRPDAYGREAAHYFAEHLARRGVAVVSGFAVGIDAAAHRGAVEAGGPTVAVLGCGVDVAYPRAHRHLATQVVARGAMISEFPCGAPPRPLNFPVRNRIIAALAHATLVVQAAPRSGSLITARHALALGREVCALPGRIFDETALGTNALLRDGATPALHPDDLLPPGVTTADEAEELPPPLPGLAATLWQAMRPRQEATAEALVRRVGEPLDRVLGALLELELGGWVVRHPGPRWTRRR